MGGRTLQATGTARAKCVCGTERALVWLKRSEGEYDVR